MVQDEVAKRITSVIDQLTDVCSRKALLPSQARALTASRSMILMTRREQMIAPAASIVFGYRGAANAEHLGEEFLREHDCVALGSVSGLQNLASSRCTALHAAPIRACVSRPSLLRRQRSAIALLEETVFPNSVEAIFPANIGSWAMALTCHLQGNIPDMASTAPSRPTVPVSWPCHRA
jgi:hypothetical protein